MSFQSKLRKLRVITHVNAIWLNSIGSPLGNQDGQGKGQHIVEAARQLKQDDCQSDRQSRHTTHGGSGCNEAVDARLDAGTI